MENTNINFGNVDLSSHYKKEEDNTSNYHSHMDKNYNMLPMPYVVVPNI